MHTFALQFVLELSYILYASAVNGCERLKCTCILFLYKFFEVLLTFNVVNKEITYNCRLCPAYNVKHESLVLARGENVLDGHGFHYLRATGAFYKLLIIYTHIIAL